MPTNNSELSLLPLADTQTATTKRAHTKKLKRIQKKAEREIIKNDVSLTIQSVLSPVGNAGPVFWSFRKLLQDEDIKRLAQSHPQAYAFLDALSYIVTIIEFFSTIATRSQEITFFYKTLNRQLEERIKACAKLATMIRTSQLALPAIEDNPLSWIARTKGFLSNSIGNGWTHIKELFKGGPLRVKTAFQQSCDDWKTKKKFYHLFLPSTLTQFFNNLLQVFTPRAGIDSVKLNSYFVALNTFLGVFAITQAGTAWLFDVTNPFAVMSTAAFSALTAWSVKAGYETFCARKIKKLIEALHRGDFDSKEFKGSLQRLKYEYTHLLGLINTIGNSIFSSISTYHVFASIEQVETAIAQSTTGDKDAKGWNTDPNLVLTITIASGLLAFVSGHLTKTLSMLEKIAKEEAIYPDEQSIWEAVQRGFTNCFISLQGLFKKGAIGIMGAVSGKFINLGNALANAGKTFYGVYKTTKDLSIIFAFITASLISLGTFSASIAFSGESVENEINKFIKWLGNLFCRCIGRTTNEAEVGEVHPVLAQTEDNQQSGADYGAIAGFLGSDGNLSVIDIPEEPSQLELLYSDEANAALDTAISQVTTVYPSISFDI